ncbi:hypothetical protein DFJ77DRAFT_439754 [Powellomyces hirtus]|nr:hypothetical protein DFJ77DRAFT_439754 [Powellomyces hirtus]
MHYYDENSGLTCWLISAVWVALAGGFALKGKVDGGHARVLLIAYCTCLAIAPFLWAIIPLLFWPYDHKTLAIFAILFESAASVIFSIAMVVVFTTLDGTRTSLPLKSHPWIGFATISALAFILSSDVLAIVRAASATVLFARFSYAAAVIGYFALLSTVTALQLVLTNGTETSVAIEEGGLELVSATGWRSYLPIYIVVVAKIVGPMLQLILQDRPNNWGWWYDNDAPVAVLSAVIGSIELFGMIGLGLRGVPFKHGNWAERLFFGRAEGGAHQRFAVEITDWGGAEHFDDDAETTIFVVQLFQNHSSSGLQNPYTMFKGTTSYHSLSTSVVAFVIAYVALIA